MELERSDKNLGRRALKGAAFLAGARFIVRLFSLINLVVLARLLTPEDYGLAALAFVALAMVQVFSDLRVTDGLMALDDLDRGHLDTAFTMQAIRGVLIGIAVFFGAGLAARIMGAAEIEIVMQVLAFVLIIDGLKNPAYFMYQRNVDFSRVFIRDATAAVAASLITIAAAAVLRNYWALVIGTIVGRSLQTLLTYVRIAHRPGLTLKYWRDFLSFGAWLTFTGMINQLNELAPRLLIGRMISPATLGLFMVGRDTSSLATRELVEPLRRTLFPSFSAIKHDKPRLARAILMANATLLAVALPIGIGIALIAQEVVIIVLGQKWLDATFVLRVLAPMSALAMSVAAATSLMMALKEVRAIFVRSFVLGLVTWPAIYIGIREGGLEGAVIGLACATLLNIAINIYAIKQFAGIALLTFLRSAWRSFIAIGAMMAVLLVVPRGFEPERGSLETLLYTAPYICLGAAVYIGVHALLWHLSGRPDGPERYIVHYGAPLLGKLRRASPAPRPVKED